MQTHISSMTRILRLTLLVAMLMTAGAAGATKYVREPTMEDLAQVWIGTVPKGILEFFRLELDDKGVGLLTVQYLPQEPARAYRVRRTTLAKYEVRFVLEPLGADAEPVYLRGQAIPGSLDLDGLSIQQRRAITPLADRFDGGAGKLRISLAVHDAEGQRFAVHPNDRVKNYAAFDPGCLGSGGIDWLDVVEKFCGLYFATETQPRRFSPGFRSWQSLGGPFHHDIHFLHDCGDFQRDPLGRFAAGLQHDLWRSIYFKSALHYFHLILTGRHRRESEIAVSV